MAAALLLLLLQNRDFLTLLDRVAEGWNEGDARMAAECFTEHAVYVEPPDRQIYRGREALYRFFGGESGRPGAMSMTWRNAAFDEERQVGFGEFTFSYGSQVHGAVVIQLRGGEIHRWREYWYASELPYAAFASDSAFTPAPSSADFTSLMESLAGAWNDSDAEGAAELFSEDAIYLEPPDRQVHRGRKALRAFFAETASVSPMTMTWHHLAFDSGKGIGAGEYTFEWRGTKLHGIAWVQVENGLIHRWRKYQYSSELDWESFVGESAFVTEASGSSR